VFFIDFKLKINYNTVMKRFLILLLPAVIATSAVCGCKTTEKSYQLYTNIPQEHFKLTSTAYNANILTGGAFGGAVYEKPENANGFSTKGKEWDGIINTDITANLYFSDNFENAGTVQRYESLCGDIQSVLDDINNSLSATYEKSSLYLFNSAPAGEKVEITETAYNVLQIAKTAYEFTGGYYNPAVYYSVEAYGFGNAETCPQTAEELPSDVLIEKYNTLSQAFGSVELTADAENGKFYAQKPQATVEAGGETLSVKLDLGGIGKGYATDVISGLIDKYGFKYGHFDFGGSSNVYKNHYTAGCYSLAITDPRNPFGGYYMTTPVACESISTSGDNVQFYFLDGVRYCHVINPVTGKPVQTGICSATVLGGSAAESDAYTTAIMAMGKDRAVEFIQNKLTDRRVVFTYDSASDLS